MAYLSFFADADPGLPTNVTALGLLAFVVFWLFRRLDSTDKRDQSERDGLRVTGDGLRQRIEVLEADNALQHRLKHAALNDIAGLKARQVLIERNARSCTCGAMAPVLILFDTPNGGST